MVVVSATLSLRLANFHLFGQSSNESRPPAEQLFVVDVERKLALSKPSGELLPVRLAPSGRAEKSCQSKWPINKWLCLGTRSEIGQLDQVGRSRDQPPAAWLASLTAAAMLKS